MTGLINVIRKFSAILTKKQKKRIFPLVILMMIGGTLESYSVSLIMPFMSFVMNPDESMDKWYAILICNVLGINTARGFIVIVAVFLALLYIFKNIFLTFEYNIQYRFVYNNMFDLQSRLLYTVIHRPYEYYLDISSGDIIRTISTDTANAFNVLTVLLSLCSETIVSAMLIVVIFAMAPIITVCIAVVLLIMLFLIYKVVKPVLRQAGLNQVGSQAEMNKWVLQSIQGIKEMKVMKKESFFQRNFGIQGRIYVKSLRQVQTLSNAPRFIIEGVCLGAMFTIVAVMIYNGGVIEQLVPVLTVIAMAAIRLLPAVNRISGALNTVAFGEAMVDKVLENLQTLDVSENIDIEVDKKTQPEKSEEFNKEIILDSLSYRYPHTDEDVFNKASMTIKKGESIGIVGESGAGKTTLIDIVLGLLIPQKGSVIVDDMNINEDMGRWLDQVSYVPQSIFMLDESIRSNVAFGEEDGEIDDERVWKALSEAALSDFINSLPDGINTEIGERGIRLSGGQRQRIGIARALYRSPEIIIFDEATSALDNDTEEAIMESIAMLSKRKTVIIIAHRLSTIESCDHVYRVENKRIVKER